MNEVQDKKRKLMVLRIASVICAFVIIVTAVKGMLDGTFGYGRTSGFEGPYAYIFGGFLIVGALFVLYVAFISSRGVHPKK